MSTLQPVVSFLQRHIASVALAIELSTLTAVLAFLIAATLGVSATGNA